MSAVTKRPNYFQYWIPAFILILIGIMGRIWVIQTGEPGAWTIVLLTALGFTLNGFFTWKLSSYRLHFRWTPLFYKAMSVFFFAIAVAILLARYFLIN